MNRKLDVHKTVGIAVFSALSVVVSLVCQVIPPIAGFLSLDVKDAIISIAAFVFGPLSGVIIALIAALVELVTFSTTGWYGFLMNFISSAIFSLTAATIYKKVRTLNGALIGYFAAILATVSAMLVMNIFVTPLYMVSIGVPMTSSDVIAMIPKVLFPFNFAKALLNSAVAMLLYKQVSTAFVKARLVDDKMETKFNIKSVIVLCIGCSSLIISIFIFIWLNMG